MPASDTSPRTRRLVLFAISAALGGLLYLAYHLGTGAGPEGNGTPTPGVQPWTAALFSLRLEPTDGGWQADGEAELPEGTVVRLELAYGDEGRPVAVVAEQEARVGGDRRLSAGWGPESRPWPSGRYVLNVHTGIAGLPVAEAIRGEADAAIEEEMHSRLHYLRFARLAGEAVRRLEETAARAAETLEASEAGTGASAPDRPWLFFDAAGAFDPEAWRTWVDEEYRGTVRTLDRWQAAERERFAIPRMPDPARRARTVLDGLDGVAARLTSDLRSRAGLPPSPGETAGEAPAAMLDAIGALAAAAGVAGVEPPSEDIDDRVEVDGVTAHLRRRGDSHVLTVEGPLPVPEGAYTTVELRFHSLDNLILATAPTTRPHFRMRVDGLGRTIPAGMYHLRLALDPRSQPPEVREAIEEGYPHLEETWEKTVSFPLAEETGGAEENRRIVHYEAMLIGASRLFWEAKATLDAAARQEAYYRDGHVLDVPALQAWIDENERAMEDLARRHEAFRGETVAPKYGQEDSHLAQLFRLIREQRDGAFALLTGREVAPNEPFQPLEIRQGHLNKHVRDHICPRIGLDPVTLGSLRLGEARRALRSGDDDRALEMLDQLADRSIEEPGVEATAHLEAARIHERAGREWLAVPHLRRIVDEKRYAKQDDTVRAAERMLDDITEATEKWAAEKQAAYRAHVDDLLDTLVAAREDGRGGAFRRAIERWYVELLMVRRAIRKSLDDDEAAGGIERRDAAVTECFAGPYRIEKLVKQGRLDEVRRLADGDDLPYARAFEGYGVPGAILEFADEHVVRSLERADTYRERHERVREAGIEVVGLTYYDRAVLVRLDGEEEPVVVGGQDKEIRDGVRTVGIRKHEGGATVTLALPDGEKVPIWIATND